MDKITTYSSLLLYAVVALLIFSQYQHIPPYMDEIFHFPQYLKFHSNDYTWDPKITTPPGLYLTTLLIDSVTITSARTINIIFSFIFVCVLYTLRKDYFVISMFPLSFFYSFLYYTDMGSTLFVLMGYKLSRDKRFNLSALFLGLAMLFRQTNVIWVVFVAAVAAVELLQIFKKITPNTGFDLVYYAVLHLGFLMSWLYSYFGLVVAFIVFVKMNGSIVLGDKSNHEASIHVPQMFYFILFTFGFAFFALDPFALVKPTYYKIRNNIKSSFFGLGLMFYCVHKYTIAHIFILSDNRHYTFYLWRYILKYELVRYLLVPVYFVVFIMLSLKLGQSQSVMFCMLFFGATFASLVFSPLIEFRYYIIPYFIYRVHIKVPSRISLLCEFLVYFLVNLATIYAFLYRPFNWEHESGDQRFMW